MLSYRHAFHAGNHADVLKHITLIEVIHYALQKEKPIHYIDTHAGAGLYRLDSDYAQKNAEFTTGVLPIMQTKVHTEALQRYQACVQFFNGPKQVQYYPGSPHIAAYQLRTIDPLHLFELHPSDVALLEQNAKQWQSHGKTCHIAQSNGFQGLKALLPPASRRGIVLIDPPYEQKQDYQTVIAALQEAIKRFANGTYLLWYPCLNRPEPDEMLRGIDKLLKQTHLEDKCLHATLHVTTPQPNGFGMYGSGMVIINPPWTLAETLRTTMQEVCTILGGESRYAVESQLI